MKVIITRPLEDARPLAAKLKARGHEALVLPLLSIEARADVMIPRRAYQGICLTSANAIRVLPDVSAIAAIPVFAVGPQSLRMAQEKGFSKVEAQGGDVVGLHAFLVHNRRAEDGPLLYFSGSETSGDLHGRLLAAGFDVDRVVTYDAVATQLRLDQAEEIKAAQAVVLYSPRSAKLWVKQVEALNLGGQASLILHLCLSTNVAANLPQSWARAVAVKPNEEAMLALLDCAAKAE
jgi:uroporphyrinogen-III synthase